MRLTDLEPEFQRITKPGKEYDHVEQLADAQGVMFLCPACFAANGGAVGTHSVLCWFRDRGVPADETPGPGRWPASGSGKHDLTLTGSVHLKGGCGWHGFITNGEVRTV